MLTTRFANTHVATRNENCIISLVHADDAELLLLGAFRDFEYVNFIRFLYEQFLDTRRSPDYQALSIIIEILFLVVSFKVISVVLTRIQSKLNSTFFA